MVRGILCTHAGLSSEHVGPYPLLLHTPQMGSDTSGHSCLSTGVPVFPRHTSLQNILLAEEAGEEKEHVISRELKKMVRDKAHMTVSTRLVSVVSKKTCFLKLKG